MTLTSAVIESWSRQTTILDNLCDRIVPDQLPLMVAREEWTIGHHLCHIHEVRCFWLSKVAPDSVLTLAELFCHRNDKWVSIYDLELIRDQLGKSAKQVSSVIEKLLAEDAGAVGPYSHPLFFLQHMIWHEGWHVSSIMAALRINGHEPPPMWEEEKIWAIWRS